MCDTLVIRSAGVSWLAKNSDREPAEPQRLVFIPAVQGERTAQLRCTYVSVAQVSARYALVLSQPVWLWGGEIGINERGVAIGNEAVFSKLAANAAPALLGMDLLRLGLERGGSAREALAVMTELLATHGQGGAGGFRDKSFCYDNSYLIADPQEAFVLETAGRLWAAKRVERWAISNAYSIGSDYDLSSSDLPGQARALGLWNGRGDFHFARAVDTWLYPFVGGAHARRALNQTALDAALQPGWSALAARLRDHGRHGDDFARHDNRQICLHAGGILRPSQTTASLIARLTPQTVRYAATGTSAPCLSLFEPARFGAAPPDRWHAFEPVHRRALFDDDFRRALRAGRDACEARLLAAAQAETPDWTQIAADGEAFHRHWQAQAALPGAPPVRSRFARWWARQGA